MISLRAIETKEDESFMVVRGESFDGMAMEAAEAHLYRGEQLAARVKIYPYGVS